MNKNKILNLITKKISKNIDHNEAKQLDEWVKQNKDHEDIIKEYENIWSLFDSKKKYQLPDIHQELLSLKKQLHNAKQKARYDISPMEKNRSRISRHIIWSAAAAIIIICGYLVYNVKFASTYIKTKNAQIVQQVLPDGSNIMLNAASQIKYDYTFGKSSRIIELNGEAYFEVKKEKNPFIVMTENSKIKVLGTKFNIRTRKNQTKVIVEEGVVSFQSTAIPDDTNHVILHKNEMAICSGNYIDKSKNIVDAAYLIGWIQNTIIFNQTKINDVIEELLLIYNKKIMISPSVSDTISISGSFKDKSIEDVLEAICIICDLKWGKKENNYFISK